MKKSELIEIYEEGLKRESSFLIVKIETEGNPGSEIIINPSENFAAKMSYYKSAYNDDLELIRAKESGKTIRIVDALMTNNFHDLNWFAY